MPRSCDLCFSHHRNPRKRSGLNIQNVTIYHILSLWYHQLLCCVFPYISYGHVHYVHVYLASPSIKSLIRNRKEWIENYNCVCVSTRRMLPQVLVLTADIRILNCNLNAPYNIHRMSHKTRVFENKDLKIKSRMVGISQFRFYHGLILILTDFLA